MTQQPWSLDLDVFEGPFDLLIGATAFRHGRVIVTNNVREFGDTWRNWN